ncbi:TadE/TadG family type IV pilus assembly protein [Pseudonocardia sp.]|uniref:TadE/TadG family type IV pilus assembly protein n=1 Tax=Pseudonocardia sp. TaxID=60912 RepID=UPI003D0FD2FA
MAGDDGSVSVELVVAVPLLLVLLLAVLQVGVWWHATHVAEAAAAHALAAARVQDGTAAAGENAGRRVLGQLANQLLVSPRVDVTRAGDEVRVQVDGPAMRVLPGLDVPVRVAVAGVTEPPS